MRLSKLALILATLAACQGNRSDKATAPAATETVTPAATGSAPAATDTAAQLVEIAQGAKDRTEFPDADSVVHLERDAITLLADGSVVEHHRKDGGKDIWVDPADEHGQFGYAYVGQDNLVLPIVRGANELGRRPPLDPTSSVAHTASTFKLGVQRGRPPHRVLERDQGRSHGAPRRQVHRVPRRAREAPRVRASHRAADANVISGRRCALRAIRGAHRSRAADARRARTARR